MEELVSSTRCKGWRCDHWNNWVYFWHSGLYIHWFRNQILQRVHCRRRCSNIIHGRRGNIIIHWRRPRWYHCTSSNWKEHLYQWDIIIIIILGELMCSGTSDKWPSEKRTASLGSAVYNEVLKWSFNTLLDLQEEDNLALYSGQSGWSQCLLYLFRKLS